MFYLRFLVVFSLLYVTSCKPPEVKVEVPTPKLVIKNTSKPSIIITKQGVLGKINYSNDTHFKKVDIHYLSNIKDTIYAQKTTLKAFLLMASEAKKSGVQFKIISGTRNFYEQKSIWERKWEKYNHLKPIDRAKKILEFSAMPTTSRHHWGTDIDLNNLNNSYFESGKGKLEYQWLVENANKFGFYQVYTSKKKGRMGYNEEKWHWSYIPLAKQYLAYYKTNIKYTDIQDFQGASLAKDLKIIEKYVFGISKNIPQR